MPMFRPTVLILASDAEFAREITSNWPHEPASHVHAPEFVVLDEGLTCDLIGDHYDLAIADASFESHFSGKSKEPKADRRKRLNKRLNKDLKQMLTASGKPAILIHSDPSRDFYNIHGAVLDLRREPEAWPAIAGLMGREILRRHQAETTAQDREQCCANLRAEATLGRFMIEMRTSVNNALTTVLGNAELLAHNPGLPASAHAQADAIRNMALRLHEVFQRFSSIENELNVAARDSGKKAMSAVAGR